ncbi:hypothetical protein MHW47_10735 [Streptomyces sp. OfavH-34-F]|uniref:hypothetical protein n=1 Tax=Streptomyces sp. OfavH-34-F TaxID=2917760 RepID=UPI001EF194AA|nr:hypothetical protein [Streptomyces sp. OfavH-34-F]MCG7524909.1 hypothetical protein [Streptomyces sp. OfavH-34-F]
MSTYVDRDGDRWIDTGRRRGGDPVLACPHPITPADAGTGPSYPWTYAEVRAHFGPLVKETPAA